MQREDWKSHRLDQLGFVGRGRSRSRPRNDPALYGGSYPLFETGDIKSADLYLSEPKKTYNEKGLAQSKLWNPGTLCITIAANIAETAILEVKACFPDSIVGFVADPKKADVRYVKYYIDFIKLQMQNISRGTTQDNLSVEKLLSFDFFTPPLETQHKIGSILSAYDDFILNNTRRIKILEDMAQTLYREWFVNFRFPGHEQVKMVESELGLIPEKWEVGEIKDFGKVICGKTPPVKDPENYSGTMPFIRTPDMHGRIFVTETEKYISEKWFKKQPKRTLPTSSICVSCIGSPGVVALTSEPSQTNQQINSVVPANKSYSFYCYFMLRELSDVVQLYAKSGGAVIPNVSTSRFASIPCIIPRNEVMVRYQNIIQPLFERMLLTERQSHNLRQTRDLFLPKLISGELDVSGLDIDVSESE